MDPVDSLHSVLGVDIYHLLEELVVPACLAASFLFPLDTRHIYCLQSGG